MVPPSTLSSLEAFATQAALAIESARLCAEKARLDRDLRIAADIQRALLPESLCERESFDLAAVSVPCRTVGGDFFDYLDIEERTNGDVTIVTVTGDIKLGNEVVLKDKVQSLLQQGHKKLLLDLAGVAYVDSAGLGQVVQCYVTATRHDGALKLLHLNGKMNDLLVVTKLATVFETFEDEAAAVQSF